MRWPRCSGPLSAALAICLVLSVCASAWAQDEETILDPTHPDAAPSDATGAKTAPEPEETEESDEADEAEESDEADGEETIFDPTRPDAEQAVPRVEAEEQSVGEDGEESIFDPTRPGAGEPGDGDDSGDEDIGDPTRPDPGPKPKEAREQPPEGDKAPAFMRIGYVLGRYRSLASIDTKFDNEHEDVIELRNELSFAIRYDASAVVSAYLEGRFTHWFTAERGNDDQDFFDDTYGSFDVDLREAYLRFSLGDFAITVGNQFMLWGTTDLFTPTQVVHRRDFRYGAPFESTEDLIPIFALDVQWFAMDGLTLEAWLQPFRSSSASQFLGNDFSIASPGSPLYANAQLADAVDRVVNGGGGEALDTAFQSFNVADARISDLSTGLRASGSFAGIDLGAAYLYGWDDTPTVRVSDDLRVILRALAVHPEVLQTLDPTPILLEPGVLQAAGNLQNQSADEIFDSTYDRRHTLTMDFQTYIGPVGIRLESAFDPNKTWIVFRDATLPGGLLQPDRKVRELATRRMADLNSVLGVSWESSDTRWFVAVEGFYRRLFGLNDDTNEVPFLGAQDLYGTGLLFRTAPVDALEIELGGIWTLTYLADVVVLATIRWEVVSGLDLLARYVFFHGPKVEEDITIGGVYTRNDHVTLGLDWRF